MGDEKKKSKPLGTVVLKLSTPVEFGDELIEELEFRRPTAGDIENLGTDAKMKDMLQIGARCARQPYSVIRKLSAQDAIKVVEVVGDFLDSGPATGSVS